MKKITILFALIAVSIYGLKAQVIWSTNSNGINYNEGNVGIGTSSPAAGLHVAKTSIFNGNMIAVILGNEYNHWTYFGGVTAGRIRGSNEGYLFIEGNPNGSGDKSLYLNYSSSGNVLMANGGGNVGIGTAAPYGKLHVFSQNSPSQYYDGELHIGGFIGTTEDITMIIGTHYTNKTTFLQGWRAGFGSAPILLQPQGGNVGIGTTNPQYKLAVKGTIGCGEIKVEVTSGWADFVFHPTYKLRSLGEVEQFIKTNNHLPEIPTATEVKENGVSLGEMNAKLLQKVEELTLYILELNKRIEQLEKQRK